MKNRSIILIMFIILSFGLTGCINIPVHEHNFIDGVCDCGEIEPTVGPAKYTIQLSEESPVETIISINLSNDGNQLLGPFCQGQYALVLTTSEQSASYQVDMKFSLEDDYMPFELSLDNNTWANEIEHYDGVVNFEETVELTIYWRWNTTSDEKDTILGSEYDLNNLNLIVKVTRN